MACLLDSNYSYMSAPVQVDHSWGGQGKMEGTNVEPYLKMLVIMMIIMIMM